MLLFICITATIILTTATIVLATGNSSNMNHHVNISLLMIRTIRIATTIIVRIPKSARMTTPRIILITRVQTYSNNVTDKKGDNSQYQQQ